MVVPRPLAPTIGEDITRAIELDQKFHELEFGLVDGVFMPTGGAAKR